MWKFKHNKIAIWSSAVVLASLIFGEITCQSHGLLDVEESTHSTSSCDLDSSFRHNHQEHEDTHDSKESGDCDCPALCCQNFATQRVDDGDLRIILCYSDFLDFGPGEDQALNLVSLSNPTGFKLFLTVRSPSKLDLCLLNLSLLL